MSQNSTHEVFNQSVALENYNLFTSDSILQEAVKREGAAHAQDFLQKFGATLGTPEVIAWGFKANEFTPVLKTFDRFGHRIDEVEYHPNYHQLMKLAVENGLHSSPWMENKAGSQVARAAAYFMNCQNEAGHCCPITMTYAVVPVLKRHAEVGTPWLEKILTHEYDYSFRPSSEKKGAIFGMAMTEKQGGSDVRANTTKAESISSNQNEYVLTGHKWFCSAPMSDAFLVLAQLPEGLTCFLVPRFKPDGTKNNFFIQRLKNKLGNKSNASSEVEWVNTWAQRLGDPGRGVPTIIEMVNHTRFDCVLGSSALMRRALAEALHHAHHRSAFGKKLIDQPLMKNVLSDLALESEAATVLMMRLARAFDSSDPEEQAFRRLATAISKYWVCKRAPFFTYEAMECLGGAGYVEESILPRLYRETPVNSIWEGSGNVNCLDVLRAVQKDPLSLEMLFKEIAQASHPVLNAWVEQIKNDFSKKEEVENQARHLVERLVLALQASLILRNSPSFISDAYIATRLQGSWGHAFGTLNASTNFEAILKRAWTE
jgi:putative acyl-CoA dehydrogenase